MFIKHRFLLALLTCYGVALLTSTPAFAQGENQIAGSWRMVSAVVDPGGPDEERPYGSHPRGLLTFSPNGTFVELLQNPDIPEFEANALDEGSREENAAAMAGALGQFGTYSVDEDGVFESNTIVGSTFPNWNGLRRVRPRLSLTVRGDQLIEELRDPGAPLIRIVFERVR